MDQDQSSISESNSENNDSEEIDDEYSNSDSETELSVEKGESAGNSKWVDAMTNVLKSSSKSEKLKRNLILSKALKDKEAKRRKTNLKHEIEIVSSDGKEIVEKIVGSKPESKPEVKENKESRSRIDWDKLGRIKPTVNIEEKERERFLSSIATKGVVQLFNAVKEQQKTIQKKLKEAGPSETKRDKTLAKFTKGHFLDKLKGKQNEKKVEFLLVL